MPVLIAIIVVSFALGLLARPPVARAAAIGLAVLANAVIVWAIADGKGDDPAWLLVLSIIGGLLAVGAAQFGGRLRADRAARAEVR